MVSWNSPRRSAYRDDSPASIMTPLSPTGLPQWLRSRPRAGFISSTRIKYICVALGCMLLGWALTSALGPRRETDLDLYDDLSSDVLTDPSGYGTSPDRGKSASLLDENEMPKKPSFSGALTELHHAVNDKLQEWYPYSKQPYGGSASNPTGKKKPGNATAAVLDGEYIKDGISDEDRLGARTRIGKCTILFNGNSYWERAIRTHEEHDRMHGYRLHVLRQQLMDDVWSKPAYILSLLLRELGKPESERLDWLFWVDADTIILNPHIPIETFLPPPGTEFENVHLMYSNDWNGLNNGVFPIRVNRWSVQMFSAITSFRYYRPDEPLVFRDQSAMNYLMQEPAFSKNIVQAPQRWFNAYQGEHNETLQPYQIRRGDLLVHFAGVGNREERMGYWLDRAEQHLDDWEVPVKSTSYPQEARDFWNEQRDIQKNIKVALDEQRFKALKLITDTDEHLREYSDRLTGDQMEPIIILKDRLGRLMEDEKTRADIEKIADGTKRLSEACAPLNTIIANVHKLILNSAHEAIFAGEKDILEGSTEDSAELQQISTGVKNLKNLVMAPEEFWNRQDIAAATNVLTEARARLQEKKSAILDAAKKQEEEMLRLEQAKEEKAKTLEEARKQMQAEVAAVGGGEEPAGVTVILIVPGPVVTATPLAQG